MIVLVLVVDQLVAQGSYLDEVCSEVVHDQDGDVLVEILVLEIHPVLRGTHTTDHTRVRRRDDDDDDECVCMCEENAQRPSLRLLVA
jgi:hypothetical protein